MSNDATGGGIRRMEVTMSDVASLKANLADWKQRLSGPDVHTVSSQIGVLLWRSALYRSINESRRFLLDDKEHGKKANGPLHELVDEGYFILHATAIRRLLDKGAVSGPRGVHSLYGLVRDIQESAGLLTRSNVLLARGLEYHFEPLKWRAHAEARQEARAKGAEAYFVSKDGWAESEYWHGVMDQLAGVSPDRRDGNDVPDRSRLDRLVRELEDRGRSVQDWVDKFVAHPATPESRQTLQPQHQTLSLAKLWLAERVVVRAAGFVSLYFVDGMNLGGVPVPQFDQFAYLDRPFIEGAALEPMRRAWSRHSREIQDCQNWFWDRSLVDASDAWDDATG